MDAIVLLKADHKKVKGLFKEFEKGKDTLEAPERRALVDEMIRELTTHAYIEETVFYPSARESVPGIDDHVLESVEEHHVVAWLLSELQRLDPEDETFNAKVTVLIENVRHHVEEEETEFFPEVRKALGRKRLGELGDELMKARPQAPADPLRLTSAAV